MRWTIVMAIIGLLLLVYVAKAQSVFADLDAVCRSWGTRPGTDAYVQCRMYQSERRRRQLQCILGGGECAAHVAPYTYEPPRTTTTSCVRAGISVICNQY